MSGQPGAERICGFDLADGEAECDPEAFVPLVEEARNAGMGITIHSGENTDAAHVARTLALFRPSRIGHGIRSWGNENEVTCFNTPELRCPGLNGGSAA